jgi:hypothetical protein
MSESWLQVLSLFLANAGLMIWFRCESRNDWRHMDDRTNAIQQEIKDFHGRLCSLEEKNRK